MALVLSEEEFNKHGKIIVFDESEPESLVTEINSAQHFNDFACHLHCFFFSQPILLLKYYLTESFRLGSKV